MPKPDCFATDDVQVIEIIEVRAFKQMHAGVEEIRCRRNQAGVGQQTLVVWVIDGRKLMHRANAFGMLVVPEVLVRIHEDFVFETASIVVDMPFACGVRRWCVVVVRHGCERGRE